MGYILAATQFVAQFTPVSRHPGSLSRTQTFKFRDNCFVNETLEIH